MRVGILLVLLFGVSLWGWRDVRSRRERNAWERPLSIAIVLVRRGPLDDSAVRSFRKRVAALEARLTDECHRYRSGPSRPFALTFVGPIDDAEDPPRTDGEGVIDSAKESWALWRWASRVDREAGIDAGSFDSRIYVAAREPQPQDDLDNVEGEGQQGGRLGAVEVDLDGSMVDFALFVAAHELFHTLGATDKYDASGRTLVPAGLASPALRPLFPQPCAEVMARNRPVSAAAETPPDRLDELGVGPLTAREVGWVR